MDVSKRALKEVATWNVSFEVAQFLEEDWQVELIPLDFFLPEADFFRFFSVFFFTPYYLSDVTFLSIIR